MSRTNHRTPVFSEACNANLICILFEKLQSAPNSAKRVNEFMEVQCNSCFSEYEIDSSIFQQGHAKLKCAHCRHIFVVQISNDSSQPAKSESSLESLPTGFEFPVFETNLNLIPIENRSEVQDSSDAGAPQSATLQNTVLNYELDKESESGEKKIQANEIFGKANKTSIQKTRAPELLSEQNQSGSHNVSHSNSRLSKPTLNNQLGFVGTLSRSHIATMGFTGLLIINILLGFWAVTHHGVIDFYQIRLFLEGILN
jgi:ribosomal protein S27E